MKYVFLIQARMGSTRLPHKVLMDVRPGQTLLESVYNQVRKSKYATAANVFLLTSSSAADDPLASFAIKKNITVYRGEEKNVYKRFYDFLAILPDKPDYILRICADNPLLDTGFIDQLIDYAEQNKAKIDYLSFYDPTQDKPAILTHYGFFCEMISLEAFLTAEKIVSSDTEKEHVTPVFYRTQNFKPVYISMPDDLTKRKYRFTIDTKEDLEIVRHIFKAIDLETFTYKDVLREVEKNPAYMESMTKNIIENSK